MPASMTYYPVSAATSGIDASKRIYVFYEGLLEVYNPQRDSWTSGDSVPKILNNPDAEGVTVLTDREFYGATVLNDTIYTIGGRTITYSNNIPYSPYMPGIMTEDATNEQYIPIGYGTPDPSYVLETNPPKISVQSPVNQTYSESIVPLVFTVDKAVNWTSYSLDGRLNQTIVGNTTLAGLSSGSHSITVYSNDTFGNVGASETITFTVAIPIPNVIIVAVAGALAVVVLGAGIIIYLKKRKH